MEINATNRKINATNLGNDYNLGMSYIRCQHNKYFEECRFIKNFDQRRTCCKPCKSHWDPNEIKAKDMCLWKVDQCCKQRCCRQRIRHGGNRLVDWDVWDWDSGW